MADGRGGPISRARLAILLAGAGGADIQRLWRLSNDEVTRAQAILTVARLLEDLRVHEAAYRQPAAIADGVDVAAVLSGWTDAGRSAVLDQLRNVALTPFPIGGTDLLDLGSDVRSRSLALN